MYVNDVDRPKVPDSKLCVMCIISGVQVSIRDITPPFCPHLMRHSSVDGGASTEADSLDIVRRRIAELVGEHHEHWASRKRTYSTHAHKYY
jgi:hypothetical protein